MPQERSKESIDKIFEITWEFNKFSKYKIDVNSILTNIRKLKTFLNDLIYNNIKNIKRGGINLTRGVPCL